MLLIKEIILLNLDGIKINLIKLSLVYILLYKSNYIDLLPHNKLSMIFIIKNLWSILLKYKILRPKYLLIRIWILLKIMGFQDFKNLSPRQLGSLIESNKYQMIKIRKVEKLHLQKNNKKNKQRKGEKTSRKRKYSKRLRIWSIRKRLIQKKPSLDID